MKGCLSLFVALIVVIGPYTLSADQTGAEIDFSLPSLQGEVIAVSEFRGQWVILNYWATWCAPCRMEIPELSALHSEREDVAVLGLAFEDTDDAAFEAFLSEFDVTYPLLRVDVYAPPQPFGAPKVLPTTYVLDPMGREVKAFLGPVTREDIEEFIAEHPLEASY